ncbi:MAG: Ca2+:H+ antiporter [Thermoleophilaceae bacterium]|jgi:Ca2+:H+ antiporter|nr:Ca2+:H+ antiporter [Thermoleophilaceae bacterium]
MGAITGRQRLILAAIAVITAVAGFMHYADASPTATFIVAALALAGLAWIVSFATEQVGQRFGPAVTGVMQSTLGNLPEFFIVVFALSAGETVVAKTSLIGSLFANALLVLGIVIVVGARAGGGTMKFGTRLPRDTTTLLLLAVFTIVIIGQAVQSDSKAAEHVKTISIVGAIVLLVVYFVWIASYLRSDGPREPAHETGASVPLKTSIVLLALSGTGAAFVSDWFINALDPAVKAIGISKEFAGLVLVAIAGNAVENATGVVLAAKGQADLAISVVKNSVAQIAAFLFPALVLVSLLFKHTLTFQLQPVYIGALLLTALAIWQITGDGEAAEFEGAALIGLYVVLGTFALAD